MNILTICQGGTVRSVCLARILKDGAVVGKTHDAVAASWQWNRPETLELLGRWAQLVVVMEPYMLDCIPVLLRGKAEICDVGPDCYGNAQHPDLMKKCLDWANRIGL